MSEFNILIAGRDASIALPIINSITEFLVVNMTSEVDALKVKVDALLVKEENANASSGANPIVGEILHTWAKQTYDHKTAGFPMNSQAASTFLQNYYLRPVPSAKELPDTSEYDLCIDAWGFCFESGFESPLADPSAWTYLINQGGSIKFKLNLVAEIASELYQLMEDKLENPIRNAGKEESGECHKNAAVKDIYSEVVTNIDYADSIDILLDSLDLGLKADMNVIDEVLDYAVRDLFSGRRASQWNTFMLKCFMIGLFASLPEVSEEWKDKQREDQDEQRLQKTDEGATDSPDEG